MAVQQQKIRWRLILGHEAESVCGALEGRDADRDAALEYLYGREGQGRDRRSAAPKLAGCSARDGKKGTLDPSNLAVPDWINAVHALFPQRTIERIETDALERYHLTQLVTDPNLLKPAEPNMRLLRAVLQTKHLMNQEVLAVARDLVARMTEQLMKKLALRVQSVFSGVVDRHRQSTVRAAQNFDAAATVRRNLRHWDRDARRLSIQTPHFFSRAHRHAHRWQVIILVDESGSMADSVIHSAVTAAIFFRIKVLRTHLVLFDTSIVDISADCADPVETIMKVQLGGGTDIGQAVSYAEKLIDNPRRAIVVLITDFYEGAPVNLLYAACQRLIAQGTVLLGLAALDAEAAPQYDHTTAAHIAGLGAHVGAMTPGELAAFVADKVR